MMPVDEREALLRETECIFNWRLHGTYRRERLLKKWHDRLYEQVYVSSYMYRWSVRLCYAYELFKDNDPSALKEMMMAIDDLEAENDGVCVKYRVSCQHIIYATLAYMQHRKGDAAFEDTFDQMPRYADMSNEQKGGVWGMKANIVRLYSGSEIKQCIDFLMHARELDPDEYNWKISLIASLTRDRRYTRERVERPKRNPKRLFHFSWKSLQEIVGLINEAKSDGTDECALLYYELSAYEDYILHKPPSEEINGYKNRITQMWRRILSLDSSTPTYVARGTWWLVKNGTEKDWDACCLATSAIFRQFPENPDAQEAARQIEKLPSEYRNSSHAACQLSALIAHI